MDSKNHISIVIPIFNEEKIIPELYNRLHSVLTKLNYTYEIIFIDDAVVRSEKERARRNL